MIFFKATNSYLRSQSIAGIFRTMPERGMSKTNYAINAGNSGMPVSSPGMGWSFLAVLIRMRPTGWVICGKNHLPPSGRAHPISNFAPDYYKAGTRLTSVQIAPKDVRCGHDLGYQKIIPFTLADIFLTKWFCRYLVLFQKSW